MKNHSMPFAVEQVPSALARALDQLLGDEIERSLSIEAMTKMLDSGISGLASLANATSVAEGRLLEKVIAVIAESNPELLVFTQVRLPVREDALELVEKNPEALYRHLTLDANARTRKSYVADLIIIDKTSRVAHVIDIKRSLGSYEAARILELRQRMLAAALVAPDLLWKDHQRVAVDEVRVVILEAAGRRTDIRNGIWSFAHLDHLIGIVGAADLVRQVRRNFDRSTEQNLAAARERLHRKEAASEGRRNATDLEGGDFALAVVPDRSSAGCLNNSDPDTANNLTDLQRNNRNPRIGIAPPPPVAH